MIPLKHNFIIKKAYLAVGYWKITVSFELRCFLEASDHLCVQHSVTAGHFQAISFVLMSCSDGTGVYAG